MMAQAARNAGLRESNILEFERIEPLIEWLRQNLGHGDSVLIKGSHALRMDRITAALEGRS
jgi:UDP-N-acetylmuramoyl-tripeptide--D-alanyl-D-alanine ligase